MRSPEIPAVPRPASAEDSGIRVALTTVPDMETGRMLARTVVEEGLAACGNVISGLTSVYSWKGHIQEDPECLVLFKTTTAEVGALMRRVVQLHPYDVPEFLALPVADGHISYMDWVREVVRKPEGP